MADTLKLIRKAVGQGMKNAGMTKPLTLIKITPGARTAGATTGGRNPTPTFYPGRGLASTKFDKVGDTIVEKTDLVVVVYGELVAVEPSTGDKIAYDGGRSMPIIDIQTGAAKASYICLCRG